MSIDGPNGSREDGPAGDLRDLTRRHGSLTPVWDGFELDESGRLLVPIDGSSITSMLGYGMRRPNLEEVMRLVHHQAQQNRRTDPGDLEVRKAVINDVIGIVAPKSMTYYGLNSEAPRLDIFVPEAQGAYIRVPSREGLKQTTRIFSDQNAFVEQTDGRDMRWIAIMMPAAEHAINIFQDGASHKIGVYQPKGLEEFYDFLEDEGRTLAVLETYMASIFYPDASPDNYQIDPQYSHYETITFDQLRSE